MTLTGARARKKFVLLLALAVVAGCTLVGPEEHEASQDDLDRAQRLWEAQRIDDYRFVMRRLCYCPQQIVAPVVVEVSGGSVESRHYQETDEPVEEQYVELWPPVDGLFGLVQDAIDRDAYRLEVQYDPIRGYPVSISIDYREDVVDEELAVEVGELVETGS